MSWGLIIMCVFYAKKRSRVLAPLWTFFLKVLALGEQPVLDAVCAIKQPSSYDMQRDDHLANSQGRNGPFQRGGHSNPFGLLVSLKEVKYTRTHICFIRESISLILSKISPRAFLGGKKEKPCFWHDLSFDTCEGFEFIWA